MRTPLVNHCPLGINHMLDKIAYDYVRAIREPGANTGQIKQQLAERVKKYSEEDKAIFDALIHSGVILDDEQIDVLHSERKEVIKGGRIELSISKLGAQ